MTNKKNKEIKEDEEILMNAIHENYENLRMNRNMDKQLREIKKREKEKKEKRTILFTKIALVVALIIVVFLGVKYNEKEIKNCMEAGYNEEFCRYAGE